MIERRVAVIGYDAAELLDIACVTTTLENANLRGAAPAYRVRLLTPGGSPITCGTGLTLQAQESLERAVGPLDTLVVSGGVGHEVAAGDRSILGHVRRLARESRRVASVCTGAALLARRVARGLVTYLQRPGNQAQMSMFTASPSPENNLVRQVVEYVTGHLDADLATATPARGAGVSERHLTRLFLEHLGQVPGRFVRQARTEAAAYLLTSTSLPMTGVAVRCGFGTTETLRQALVDRYGVPPSRYRSAATSTTRS